MKKVLFAFMLAFMSLTAFAQQTVEGNSFVGVRSTDLGFRNQAGVTTLGVGLQAGHFVQNDLALVAQAGYRSVHADGFNANDWTYGAGVKYYFDSKVPFQIDWNGSTGSFTQPAVSNLGLQLGYGIPLGARFNLEPTLRYDISLNEHYENAFSGGVGVNYFF